MKKKYNIKKIITHLNYMEYLTKVHFNSEDWRMFGEAKKKQIINELKHVIFNISKKDIKTYTIDSSEDVFFTTKIDWLTVFIKDNFDTKRITKFLIKNPELMWYFI